MKRSLLIVALALGLGACSPVMNATAFKYAAAKPSASAVEVFTDSRPARTYEEIGVIEVTGSEAGNAHYGDLIERARTRAAEMGGDAIIVTRDPATRTTGLAYVPPQQRKAGRVVTTTNRTVETPRIQVAVIAWKTTEEQ